jgi:hypothetical protein
MKKGMMPGVPASDQAYSAMFAKINAGTLTEDGAGGIGKSVGDIRYAIADQKGEPWLAPTRCAPTSISSTV